MIFDQNEPSIDLHLAGMRYVRQGLINPDMLAHEIGSACP